jgi:hypothetical protein
LQYSDIIDIGKDALSSVIDPTTGAILVQLGNATDSTPDADSAEMWAGAPGFYGLPAPPTPGNSSSQHVTLKDSDRDKIIGCRDIRDAAVYGNLNAGDRVMTAGFPGAARQFVRIDGSVTSLTTDDGTNTGNVVFARIASNYTDQSGNPALGGEWRYYAPWGGAWHDPSGYHLRTWHGVKIDAGGIVLPAPLSISGSSYTISADIVHLDAAMLALGRDNGTSQALAQALPLQAVLATLASSVNALAAAVASFTGTGAFPGLVAAETAIQAAITAVNTITTACATKAITSS